MAFGTPFFRSEQVRYRVDKACKNAVFYKKLSKDGPKPISQSAMDILRNQGFASLDNAADIYLQVIDILLERMSFGAESKQSC
ncbi:hypothetical protein D3C76_360760 [compost metagenome]